MVRRIRASLDDVLNDVQAIPALPDDLELFCVLQYHHQPLSHEHSGRSPAPSSTHDKIGKKLRWNLTL